MQAIIDNCDYCLHNATGCPIQVNWVFGGNPSEFQDGACIKFEQKHNPVTQHNQLGIWQN